MSLAGLVAVLERCDLATGVSAGCTEIDIYCGGIYLGWVSCLSAVSHGLTTPSAINLVCTSPDVVFVMLHSRKRQLSIPALVDVPGETRDRTDKK